MLDENIFNFSVGVYEAADAVPEALDDIIDEIGEANLVNAMEG